MGIHVRSRKGLLALLAALLVMGTLVGPVRIAAGQDPLVAIDKGVLELQLGAVDQFSYQPTTGPAATQAITENGCRVTLATNGAVLVTLSPLPSTSEVGLFADGIGVRTKGGNGQPCGRADGPDEGLVLKLAGSLSDFEITRAELDIEGKFDAIVVAELYLDGAGPLAVPVQPDCTAAEPLCLPTGVLSDSGPDSGDGDNYRWEFAFPDIAFDEIHLKVSTLTPSGAFSLEGGADGTAPGDVLATSGSGFQIADVVTPAIALDKVTNGADGLTILEGAPVTWTYTVTNTGNTAVGTVSVVDSDPGVAPTYESGDGNGNGQLDLGESWTFSATGMAGAGGYANVGTAGATFTNGATTVSVSATDASSYFGAGPAVSIVKTAPGGDGATLLAGSLVTWTYSVTNPGNVPLANVDVSDSDAALSPAFQSGDTDGDGLLDADETWVYEASGTVTAGVYSNVGTVDADFTDDLGATEQVTASDAASYFGATPAVSIDKTTNGSDGPTLETGTAVTWTYTVGNTGNIPVTNVTVTDDQGETPLYQSGDVDEDGLLDTTETWLYLASGTVVSGDYANIGTVAADFTDDVGASSAVGASDSSSYVGYDGIIACGQSTYTTGDGTTTPEATFTRGDDDAKNADPCSALIGFNLTSGVGVGDQTVTFEFETEEAPSWFGTFVWTPEPAAMPVPATQVDTDGDGVTDGPLVWCGGFSGTDAATGNPLPIMPAGESWCLITQTSTLIGIGTIQVTQTIYGETDPGFIRPK